MKSEIKWNGNMLFTAKSRNLEIKMDAKSPLGKDEAQTPKELVLAGMGGCTAMDVISLMKKHKQNVEDFRIEVEVEPTSGVHPAVFKNGLIHYKLKGSIDKTILIEAVELSQTKYCGVSAMLSKAFPINYEIYLNEEMIHKGQAHF